MPSTLTRAHIAEAVRRELGLPRDQCDEVVKDILRHISDGLLRDGSFKMHGFGTFIVRQTVPYMGRDPRTLVEYPVVSRKIVRFRGSKTVEWKRP